MSRRSSGEEGDAAFHRRVEKLSHLFFILRRSVREADPHAAQSNGRNVQSAFSECPFFHYAFSFDVAVTRWPRGAKRFRRYKPVIAAAIHCRCIGRLSNLRESVESADVFGLMSPTGNGSSKFFTADSFSGEQFRKASGTLALQMVTGHSSHPTQENQVSRRGCGGFTVRTILALRP